MEQNPNELNKASQVNPGVAEQLANLQQDAVVRDPSVMLNGGNPIQIGFNTTITLRPLNKDTYTKSVQSADPKVFPSGLKGLPDNFLDFAMKIEPALFEWLANKQNLAQFTSDPVAAMQKFCTDMKLQLPDNIKAFLLQTQKANAALKYNVPGVKYKSVATKIIPLRGK